MARVAGRQHAHRLQAAPALVEQGLVGAIAAQAQQRLGGIQGDADVLRLVLQGLAKQRQGIGETAHLVTAHALAIEVDGLAGGAENIRISGLLGDALHHQRIIAIHLDAIFQQRVAGLRLAQLTQLAGHLQADGSGEQLIERAELAHGLIGELFRQRRIAGLDQALGVGQARAHLHQRVVAVALLQLAEGLVDVGLHARR